MIKFHSVENWIESDEYKQSRIETKEEKISKDGKGITPELGMSDNNEKDVVEVEDKCNDYNDRQKYFDKHCVECRWSGDEGSEMIMGFSGNVNPKPAVSQTILGLESNWAGSKAWVALFGQNVIINF